MKAVVCTRYGPPGVLRLQEVPKPSPGRKEILVKVHATSVTMGDTRIRGFMVPALLWLPARMMLGFTRPRKPILGIELAGAVEALGRDVKRFREGDQIFAATLQGLGAYAQYRCVAEESAVAIKPRNLTYEEAAGVPIGARTALHYLRRARIQSGQQILVYGASGSVGTYAVQLARHFGAQVTAVCSTANLQLVRSLGADSILDYTLEDFSKAAGRYDIVFDTVGKCPLPTCMRALKHGGSYLNCTPVLPGLSMLRAALTGAAKLIIGEGPPETAEALDFLRELLEAGKIRVVIDRCYTLQEMVEAHRYVDQGHKKGNVVVSVA